jgi:hypothetical protein
MTATDPSNRKINKSSSTVEDSAILKLHLTTPPVKRIDLHFPLGMEVTARNLKGVTIKDALDAIHKAYKKRVCFGTLYVRTLTHTDNPRPMMSSTSPTSLVSSGTRKSHGPDLLFTFRPSPQPQHWTVPPLAAARRRRTRRTRNNFPPPPWYLFQ